MARDGFYITLGQALTGTGTHNTSGSRDPGADIEAAVAVLVADGASPTQAHVNNLVTALARRPDFQISFDPAVITTRNRVKSCLAQALLLAQASGIV